MSKGTIYKNALILETLTRLSPQDKQKAITELLKNKTERQLSKEINVPHSTIHDWKTLRQSNVGAKTHASLSVMVRKLEAMKPEDVKDWGRIQQINEITSSLLRRKKIV